MATNLILLVSLGVFRLKKMIGSQEAYVCACILTGLALLLAFIDFQIGGLIPRYTVDYTWLFFLAAASAVFGILGRLTGTGRWKTGWNFFLLLTAQAMIFHFLTVFTDVYEKLEVINPVWFYSAQYLIEFWM